MVGNVFTPLLRAFTVAALATAALSAQGLLPAPSPNQRVTVAVGASGPETTPGGVLSLWVDVTPKANIHVYAAGSKDFQPVTMAVTPGHDFTAGKVVFPAPTPIALPGVKDRVPVYNNTFRITQPVTVAKTVAHGSAIIVAATINYQACDDRVCFPPATMPVFWRLGIK
jgi:hypothetical protein